MVFRVIIIGARTENALKPSKHMNVDHRLTTDNQLYIKWNPRAQFLQSITRPAAGQIQSLVAHHAMCIVRHLYPSFSNFAYILKFMFKLSILYKFDCANRSVGHTKMIILSILRKSIPATTVACQLMYSYMCRHILSRSVDERICLFCQIKLVCLMIDCSISGA